MGRTDYRDILIDIYELRCKKNPSYSLKAFSRDLGLKIHISDVINKRFGISVQTANRIAKKLEMEDLSSRQFVLLVQKEHGRSLTQRKQAEKELSELFSEDYHEIKQNQFSILKNWYYLAVNELQNKNNFKGNAKWIAKQLKISEAQAKDAIDTLVEVGLAKRKKDGVIEFKKNVATTNTSTSEEIRNYHKQYLEKALLSVHNQETNQRDLSTGLFVMDKSKIDQVKERIKNFRRKLCQEFAIQKESDEEGELYCFSTQLFSLEEK